MPAVDVWEADNELVYAFDLPAIPEDKIAVEFDDGALTVSAERERSTRPRTTASTATSAASAVSRARSGCHGGATEDDVNADYRDGVLQITVKKPETPKPRRIQVGSGEQAAIEGKSKEA